MTEAARRSAAIAIIRSYERSQGLPAAEIADVVEGGTVTLHRGDSSRTIAGAAYLRDSQRP